MVAKRKTVRKSTKTRKKVKQQPKHFMKVYWPYLPILAVVIAGMLFGGVSPQSKIDNPATLAYSTEMSRSGLLSGTNTQRGNNGLGALTINSKLNSAAQAKANDMVAKDYWAHNTPSGQEPWVFFDAAGYSYQKAGENLAYGFNTSSDTIIGWMNSASHRANLLDTSYTEVGFGFANSPDYVGTGQETIVVAHYAKPVNAAPPPAPAATPAPVASSTPASSPQSLQASETKPEPNAEPIAEATAEPELKPIQEDRVNQPINTDNPVPEVSQSINITRLQRLTRGDIPKSALILSVAAFSIVIVWLIKHALLVKKFVLYGEHFVAHHPLLDLVVVVVAAISVYLSQSSGVVI